jgi:hypothetical protein
MSLIEKGHTSLTGFPLGSEECPQLHEKECRIYRRLTTDDRHPNWEVLKDETIYRYRECG